MDNGGLSDTGTESNPDTAVWLIAAVKARYLRYMDLKQWEEMRALFVDTATFEHPTVGRFDDPTAAIDAVARLLENIWTAHEAGIPDITLTGHDSATGVFAMSSSSKPPGHEGLARTFGHYYDTFVCERGVWRIASLKLVSTYRDF